MDEDMSEDMNEDMSEDMNEATTRRIEPSGTKEVSG